MKKLFVVANWKSNKTTIEAENWLQVVQNSEKEVVICPPFTLLSLVSSEVRSKQLGVKVGAQDISPFNEGAYTGEVTAKQIKEFADYVIIGHSERRKNFGETDEILFEKMRLAKENGLIVIFCVQGKETKIPVNTDIVAYEPINAIGTGNPDTPENADDVAAYFKANFQVSGVLYGGSVTAANVNSFTQKPNIDGILVGNASLDAQEFYKLIKNA